MYINILKSIESELPDLLADRQGWKSKLIVYEEPEVWRLWRPIEIGGVEYRLYLHLIKPSDRPYYHTHPWPSAIKVLSVTGSYEMGIGYGERNPPLACKIEVSNGFYYEMEEPLGWHYVKVKGGAASLMLTGKPWSSTPQPCSELNPEQFNTVLSTVQEFYPGTK